MMMQVDDRAHGRTWPDMAVHSPHMTGRGDRIRRERKRRRLSQMDLRDATGVGLRTIGRIEAGEAENSPSLEVLETYLGIRDDTLPAAERDHLDDDTDDGGLADYTTTELLAEALRRVAHMEATMRTEPVTRPREGGVVRWATSDAPSARRVTRETRAGGEGETLGGQ